MLFDLIRTYQMDIMLAHISACVCFAILLFFTKYLEKRRRIILIIIEFAASFLLFFDRLAYLYSGDASQTGYVMVRVSNFFVFALTPMMVFGFNLFLTDLISVEAKETTIPKRIKLVNVAAFFELFLVIVSQFTGLFYSFDEMNVYHRGAGFLICYIIPVVCPLIQFTVLWQYRKSLSRLIYASCVLFIFVPIIAGIIQVFTYGLSLVNMAMVLVSIIMYVFSYLDVNNAVIKEHKNEMGQLREEQKSMKLLIHQTAAALVKAVEKKDVYAKGHSERVASYARRIAEAAGKSEEACEGIYYVGLLHDLGMDVIPEQLLEDYPRMKKALQAVKERYDGSGEPEGLKGDKIPEASRIVAIAEDCDILLNRTAERDPLPYVTVRETMIKEAGILYDAAFTRYMVTILDIDNGKKIEEEKAHMEKELTCGAYKDTVSLGIPILPEVTRIRFSCQPSDPKSKDFSAPSIILFDSYNQRFHKDRESIENYHYLEYGEAWFDGHYVSTAARDMKVQTVKKEIADTSGSYVIEASRFEDHVTILMEGSTHVTNIILALPDKSKSSYIGLTGENCIIRDIERTVTENRTEAGDIEKIVREIDYKDRMESDVPNIQVDQYRSDTTKPFRVSGSLTINFHTLTLPSANLVWHCPIIVLYYSEDGTVGGEGYREYALIKLNGEGTGEDDTVENRFSMKKTEDFPGWDKWEEKNKAGMEVSVVLTRKGDQITISTENLGIAIKNTSIIKNGFNEAYVSLTGDQVALTDIRARYI